ncbi:MAG: hypothetical protein M0R32_11710 [Candidatus Cloacimonetes bacterium]|jgi:hypothetical protein|nr:hypothetical protein [Candidatus Cloacimonadota bacterium]
MKLNGCELNVLTWYHVYPECHPKIDSPSIQESIRGLVSRGILQNESKGIYSLTQKGQVFIDGLKNVPEPIQTWVMPEKV